VPLALFPLIGSTPLSKEDKRQFGYSRDNDLDCVLRSSRRSSLPEGLSCLSNCQPGRKTTARALRMVQQNDSSMWSNLPLKEFRTHRTNSADQRALPNCPYAIYYIIESSEIIIVAVKHDRRDPRLLAPSNSIIFTTASLFMFSRHWLKTWMHSHRIVRETRRHFVRLSTVNT
jgi:plasmid stabilization system protein ParE